MPFIRSVHYQRFHCIPHQRIFLTSSCPNGAHGRKVSALYTCILNNALLFLYSQILKTFRNSVMGYLIAFFLLSFIDMILPAILMDLLFYGMLFRPLLLIVYNFVLKPCFGRTFRFILHHINQRIAQRGVV